MASGAPIEAARPARNRRKWGVGTRITTLTFFKRALLALNAKESWNCMAGSRGLNSRFSIFEKGLQNCLFLLAEWPPGARNAVLGQNRVLEEAKRDFSSFSSTYHSSSQIHPPTSSTTPLQLPFQHPDLRPAPIPVPISAPPPTP